MLAWTQHIEWAGCYGENPWMMRSLLYNIGFHFKEGNLSLESRLWSHYKEQSLEPFCYLTPIFCILYLALHVVLMPSILFYFREVHSPASFQDKLASLTHWSNNQLFNLVSSERLHELAQNSQATSSDHILLAFLIEKINDWSKININSCQWLHIIE